MLCQWVRAIKIESIASKFSSHFLVVSGSARSLAYFGSFLTHFVCQHISIFSCKEDAQEYKSLLHSSADIAWHIVNLWVVFSMKETEARIFKINTTWDVSQKVFQNYYILHTTIKCIYTRRRQRKLTLYNFYKSMSDKPSAKRARIEIFFAMWNMKNWWLTFGGIVLNLFKVSRLSVTPQKSRHANR